MELPRDPRTDALGDLRVLPDELICAILDYLTPRDIARVACVSSVMNILCNEEPLWMGQCLRRLNGPLQYKGSWKKTALSLEHLPREYEEYCGKQLRRDGFHSWFLFRRLYRCYTRLDSFHLDSGNVERKDNPSLEEFYCEYDGKKPVLLKGLADTWQARQTWTMDQLLVKYGDTAFRISQRSSSKLLMKFKDYVEYSKLQHDEDPLYIFDDKFGEAAPSLLNDYSVPHLFQEDYFDILDRDLRPPFRWLIIGPERSGASWHVDPALTSAWNTLLCGRKRWALYPPGRVPLGVTVHVNEEDGDVNIESPSSNSTSFFVSLISISLPLKSALLNPDIYVQWWLDFYPLLADEDKPIECTQLPGETIFVPSGWWHCVLNLETTIAVTQNFVNSKNLEFVCLDMAPGYRHKGVCRAGLLALDEDSFEEMKDKLPFGDDDLSNSDLIRKEKRLKVLKPGEDPENGKMTNIVSKNYNLWRHDFSYDINFLTLFLDKERDHYNSPWSSGNCIGQREMRDWLYRLWVGKPGQRDLIWKGACIALDAGRWLECMVKICAFHNLPSPTEFEKLPVGTGSNPVYLIADSVVKIFVEGGLEASMYGLGTELEFHSLLSKVKSPMQNHIPEVLASGILYLENGSYKIVPWDGSGVPDVIVECGLLSDICKVDGFPFGIWGKKQYEYRKAGMPIHESITSVGSSRIWPFMITKRCTGKIFAQLRETLLPEEELSLASFLGEQLRYLHLLPHPTSTLIFSDTEQKSECQNTSGCMKPVLDKSNLPAEWEIFVKTLNRKKEDSSIRLTRWGDPIPSTLIEKVDEYIPDDFAKLINVFEDEDDSSRVCKSLSWIHSDVMDDNVHMEPCCTNSCLNGTSKSADLVDNRHMDGSDGSVERKSWRPTHILDFSDLSLGDPIYDLIPIYLDIFRGDSHLLKRFLESYKLPYVRTSSHHKSVEGGDKFQRLSYHAMCYCIVHDENILGAIFSIWSDLKTAKSWEEIEHAVWGELNNYQGSLI